MLNPSRYRILAIGKIRKPWIQNGIDLYLKRLPGLTITELRDSTSARETKSILAELKRNEKVIILSETGECISSMKFAKRMHNLGSTRLAFVIGGAEGLSHELKSSAHWQFSLSPMTFTHEMARLILVEQLYRAQSILQGGPYHRGG